MTHRFHFLSIRPSIGLRPLRLARVSFHLEVLVAFGPTEMEYLPKDMLRLSKASL